MLLTSSLLVAIPNLTVEIFKRVFSQLILRSVSQKGGEEENTTDRILGGWLKLL